MLDPETIVRRLLDEGFSQGRLEVADELFDPDLAEHQDFGADHSKGAEGAKAVIRSLRRAFSDFRLDVQDLVVDGDVVWTRNVASGTNDGSFLGNPPTGREMHIDVFDVLRVVNGRIVEHWGVPDRLGVLFQLGLMERPA
jgi:predicted ester cyclase